KNSCAIRGAAGTFLIERPSASRSFVMAASLGYVLSQIQRWTSPCLGELSDATLLERFVQRPDQTPFPPLLPPHTPMVMRACRRFLDDVQEIEDAFQAVFLILARKAHTLRQPAALPGYLHSVAHRVALKARTKSAVDIGHASLPAELPDAQSDPLARL